MPEETVAKKEVIEEVIEEKRKRNLNHLVLLIATKDHDTGRTEYTEIDQSQHDALYTKADAKKARANLSPAYIMAITEERKFKILAMRPVMSENIILQDRTVLEVQK